MEFHGLHGQIYLMQNLNQDYEDCSAFRKQLTIFGRLGYNVNLIFNRIKAGQTTSIRTNRTSRLNWGGRESKGKKCNKGGREGINNCLKLCCVMF